MSHAILVAPVFPQGLAKASLDITLGLQENLDRYKLYKAGKYENNDAQFFLDITEHIYEVSEKKHTIKIPTKDKTLNLVIQVNGKDKKLVIPFNREIVHRNVLKQLEKLKPKVYLDVSVNRDKSFKYATIIDVDGELGIYTNFYTAMTLL